MPATKAFSFEPMLCENVEWPPEGRQWHYEVKLDGFRAIGRKSGRRSQLWSRNHKDFTRRFPFVASALLELPPDTVIDGEVVALDQDGKPSFNLLQGFGGDAGNRALHVRSAYAAGQGCALLAARGAARKPA
jgi:ATP-dependent DNA ligase